jgi:hypothetical protein
MHFTLPTLLFFTLSRTAAAAPTPNSNIVIMLDSDVPNHHDSSHTNSVMDCAVHYMIYPPRSNSCPEGDVSGEDYGNCMSH